MDQHTPHVEINDSKESEHEQDLLTSENEYESDDFEMLGDYEEDEDFYPMDIEKHKQENAASSSSSSQEHDKAMWSLFWSYQNCDDYRDYFEPTYHSHSLSRSKTSHPKNGDKVIMPVSALDSLVHLRIDYPMLFQIKNRSNGKTSHCGVLEFTAEEGSVLLPDWMMRNLGLEDGDLVDFKNVSIRKAEFLKLQPHDVDFVATIEDPKAVLESTLKSFSCLSCGDTIEINHRDRVFCIDVLETRPGEAVCVNETDCEVDFAPPLNYRVETTVSRKCAGRVVFGGCNNGTREEAQTKLRKLLENVEAESSRSGGKEKKFQAFTGKKCSLLD